MDARSSLLLPSFRVCFVLWSFIVLRVFGTGGKLVIFGVVFFFAHTFCLFVSDVLNVPIELSLERVVRRIARRAFFFLFFFLNCRRLQYKDGDVCAVIFAVAQGSCVIYWTARSLAFSVFVVCFVDGGFIYPFSFTFFVRGGK